MEANVFVQKAMPIIHKYIGKYSSECIGIYPDFNGELISKFRKQCKVEDDEVVIYTHDLNFFTNGSTGAVIKDLAKSFIEGATFGISTLVMNSTQYIFALTSKYIYYRPNAETIDGFYCSWDSIDNIEAQGSTIHIDTKNSRTYRIKDVNSNITGIHPTLPINKILNMLIEIWKVTQGVDEHEKNLVNELWDEYSMVVARKPEDTDEKYFSLIKEYISYLEKEFSSMPESVQPLALKMQACLNLSAELDDRAIDNILQYKKLFGEDEELNFIYGWITGCSSVTFGGTYNEYQAYKWIFNRDISKFRFISKETVYDIQECAKTSLSENFLKYDYNDRRFLVIDSSMSYLDSGNFIVLPKNHLPAEIQFPLGHPQERELYVCHPYNRNMYIPYESYEFELFKDKMSELILVLQTMGAVSVKISDTKDLESHKDDKRHIAVQSSVKAKVNALNSELDHKRESDEFAKLRHAYETVSKFKPQRMPYIPDNLVWYPHQVEWQRLFELRKNGMMEYQVSLSVAQETRVSTTKQLELKADFQALILKTNAGVNIDTESMFEKKELSEWMLDVKFASLDELRTRENAATDLLPQKQTSAPIDIIEPVSSAELTDDDLKYMEEIRFCLEDDGNIDPKERSLLERRRVKLGISEERAAELEVMVTCAEEKLSAEEQEYCDAVTEYIADGELAESDLRLLARLASSLDITAEREKELQTETIMKIHKQLK